MPFKKILLILSLLASVSVLAANQKILVISDLHLDISTSKPMALEPSGSTWLADLDLPTYQAMLERIKKNIAAGELPKPDYIVVLGDMVAHAHTDPSVVIATEKIVFATLKEAFPDSSIVYNFGNHDSFVKNYGPFQSHRPEDVYRSPWDIARSIWPSDAFVANAQICIAQHMHYPCLLSAHAEQGYYAAYLAHNLRVISLNSVLFSIRQDVHMAPQALQQLQWLAALLADAQEQHDAVLLLSHIPPGNNTYTRAWNWSSPAFWTTASLEQFLKLVDAYSSEILGILSGHTHKDEIKIIRDRQGSPVTGIYVNAALSTINGNAPAVRFYTLATKAQRWYLHDYQVYRFTRTANSTAIGLEFLYDYQALYCPATVDSMTSCLKNISLEKMQQYYSAGNPNYFEAIKLPENITITLP